MTQPIEIGKGIFVNTEKIVGYFDVDGQTHVITSSDTAGEYWESDLTPVEITAKIKEAQANDPLERIAVALEKL